MKLAMKRFKIVTVQLAIAGLGVAMFSSAAVAKEKKKSDGVLKKLQYKANDEDRDADLKALKTEMLVKKAEAKAIKQLRKLIKRHRGTRLEPEFLHRLGELHMRRAKGDKNIELHRQSEFSVSVAPKLIKKASSKKNMRQAVDIFNRIQRKFKKFTSMDLVVFNNAFANHMLNRKKEAERLYWKLIRSFPQSQLVPDSHLAIGEMAFQQKRFKFALKHFDAVKKYPNSRVYPYSVYKAGWSKYNLRDELGAMKEMEEVVRFGKYIHDNNIDARLDLRREALADMTIFYEDVYAAENAYKYFKKQSGELDVAPTLFRLSNIYARHSRKDERRVVLDLIINNLPKSELMPSVYEAHVDNFEEMRDREKAVTKVVEFDKLCDPNSSWSEVQKVDEKGEKQGVQECLISLKDLSLKMAQKWLRLWNKNKHHKQFADVSERSFEIFLKHDDQTDRANKARVAYSDLLFRRGKFRKASLNYAVVGSRTKIKGKLGHDSRYAALLSLEKAVRDKWSDEDEKTFHELALSYVKNHPKGKFVLDIEFKKGLISYEKENYEPAAKIFLALGNRFPKEIKGKKSQDLYLDILNLKKDYKGLISYSKKLIGSTKSPIRVKKLKSIFEQSSLLEIQTLEEKGQLAKAATEYQNFTKQNPKSKLASKAWWNSVELFYKSGQDVDGAKSALQFAKLYPRDKNVLNGLYRAAKTYEEMLELSKAADILELLVKKDKKASLKWLSLAADFRYLSNQKEMARSLYVSLSKSKDPTLAAHALEQLVLIDSKSHKQGQHLNNLVALNVEPQASFALLSQLEEMSVSKPDPEVFSFSRKVVGRKGAPAVVKAKARMIQAGILEREFRRQSIKTRVERVALVLGMKTEKLEKAQRAYQAAIRFGNGPVAVEALEKLSGCYLHYSDALKKMPIPAGLPDSERDSFQGEITQLAIPIEEKGIDSLARALSEAQRLKLRSGQVRRLQAKLDKINMKVTQKLLVTKIEVPEVALPDYQEVKP